jgi:N-acetylmuramoyl-L-alanine amidase
VAELQRRLGALGFATNDDPAGTYDAATSTAVRTFQSSRRLEPTGDCDPLTWSALVESEHRLGERILCLRTPMMRGEDIAELQLRLGTLGFDSGRVDGIFGPHTQHAVGEFQRNAGIVFDEVCGPDTVVALRRLEGRGGSATVTSVRERVTLQRSTSDLQKLRVAIGAYAAGDPLAARLASQLADHVGALLLLDGDWSAQALAANQLGADVYLGTTDCKEGSVEALYFATTGFESIGGRTLAELVVRELPASPGWGIGVVRGMWLPILRETRPPAVLLRLGWIPETDQRLDLVATSLHRALQRWSARPAG